MWQPLGQYVQLEWLAEMVAMLAWVVVAYLPVVEAVVV